MHKLIDEILGWGMHFRKEIIGNNSLKKWLIKDFRLLQRTKRNKTAVIIILDSRRIFSINNILFKDAEIPIIT
ncbi:hypothetical protein ABIB50_000028 [Mucilaginibacter sp. UYCu711]